MRASVHWVWIASMALAITAGNAAPLHAAPHAAAKGKKSRSLAACTSLDQKDLDDESGVNLTVKNDCDVAVQCSMSWQLVCAPDSKSRRHASKQQSAFRVESSTGQSRTASADTCGSDAWAIGDINWSCQPTAD